MGYSRGDKVELTDGEYYLITLCYQNRDVAIKNPLWEVRKNKSKSYCVSARSYDYSQNIIKF